MARPAAHGWWIDLAAALLLLFAMHLLVVVPLRPHSGAPAEGGAGLVHEQREMWEMEAPCPAASDTVPWLVGRPSPKTRDFEANSLAPLTQCMRLVPPDLPRGRLDWLGMLRSMDTADTNAWRSYEQSFIYHHACAAPNISRVVGSSAKLETLCPDWMKPSWSTDPGKPWLHPFSKRSLAIDRTDKGPEVIFTRCSSPVSGVLKRVHVYPKPIPNVLHAASRGAGSSSRPVPPAQVPLVLLVNLGGMSHTDFMSELPELSALLDSELLASSGTTLTMRHVNTLGHDSRVNARALFCGEVPSEAREEEAACSKERQHLHLVSVAKTRGMFTSVAAARPLDDDHWPMDDIDRHLSSLFATWNVNVWELETYGVPCTHGSWIADILTNYTFGLVRQATINRNMHMLSGDAGPAGGNSHVPPLFLVQQHTDSVNPSLIYRRMKDPMLAAMLRFLHTSGLLARSVVVFTGTHGPHWNVHKKVAAGHTHTWIDLADEMAHRHPALRMFVGREVQGAQGSTPIRMAIARRNQERLLTHLDTHATLAALLGTPAAAQLQSPGINFLAEEVPRTRTCQAALVPPEWCNCWQPTSLRQ